MGLFGADGVVFEADLILNWSSSLGVLFVLLTPTGSIDMKSAYEDNGAAPWAAR